MKKRTAVEVSEMCNISRAELYRRINDLGFEPVDVKSSDYLIDLIRLMSKPEELVKRIIKLEGVVDHG